MSTESLDCFTFGSPSYISQMVFLSSFSTGQNESVPLLSVKHSIAGETHTLHFYVNLTTNEFISTEDLPKAATFVSCIARFMAYAP